jgi:hypothetical protein
VLAARGIGVVIAPGLNCSDSDAAIRALLDHCLSIHDLEIPGAGLEAAILQLTADFREQAMNAVYTRWIQF